MVSENGVTKTRSRGLCKKLKKSLCCQEAYDVPFGSAEDSPKIENSAAEYGLKYEHSLDEPLSSGSLVLVTATPSEDIPRFAINVGSGDSWSDKCEMMLHFNPRLPQRYVVRNCRTRAGWGSEETTSFRSFPFAPGRECTVQLLVTDTEWLVAVDGQHYCSFAHRVPPAVATWVQVTDIASPEVTVLKADSYPMFAPEPLRVPHRTRLEQAGDGEPEWYPNTWALLPAGVPQGSQVVVEGRLRALPHSFHVDLCEEAREWPHPRVHAHVNPRLAASAAGTRQLVVLNSWLQGWGDEIRQHTATMIGGSTVRVRIVRGAGEWQVFADDVMLGELAFRADADRVAALRVRGDLHPCAIYTAPLA